MTHGGTYKSVVWTRSEPDDGETYIAYAGKGVR